MFTGMWFLLEGGYAVCKHLHGRLFYAYDEPAHMGFIVHVSNVMPVYDDDLDLIFVDDEHQSRLDAMLEVERRV